MKILKKRARSTNRTMNPKNVQCTIILKVILLSATLLKSSADCIVARETCWEEMKYPSGQKWLAKGCLPAS